MGIELNRWIYENHMLRSELVQWYYFRLALLNVFPLRTPGRDTAPDEMNIYRLNTIEGGRQTTPTPTSSVVADDQQQVEDNKYSCPIGRNNFTIHIDDTSLANIKKLKAEDIEVLSSSFCSHTSQMWKQLLVTMYPSQTAIGITTCAITASLSVDLPISEKWIRPPKERLTILYPLQQDFGVTHLWISLFWILLRHNVVSIRTLWTMHSKSCLATNLTQLGTPNYITLSMLMTNRIPSFPMQKEKQHTDQEHVNATEDKVGVVKATSGDTQLTFANNQWRTRHSGDQQMSQ